MIRNPFTPRRTPIGALISALLVASTAAPQNPQLPLRWAENQGQWPTEIVCATVGGGHGAALMRHHLVIPVGQNAEQFVDVGLPAPVRGLVGQGPATPVSFFASADRDRWCSAVPAWAAIEADLLPGIRIAIREGDRGVRYDLHIEPGADLEAAVFEVRNAEGLSLDPDGRLVMVGAFGEVAQTAPVAWQESTRGRRTPICCSFEILGDKSYRFSADDWDGASTLVIDPTVVAPDYATWAPEVYDLEVAGNGDLLASGVVRSPFPAAWPTHDLGTAASQITQFVTRFDRSSNVPVGIALFGGSGYDYAFSIDLDAGEQHVLVGFTTDSVDFPVTDATIALLDGTQRVGILSIDAAALATLEFSTVLPDGDGPAMVRATSPGIAVIAANAGVPPRFGLPQWGPGGGRDAVFWRFDLQARMPLGGIRVGGTSDDNTSRVDVGADGSIYALTSTRSWASDPPSAWLPTTPGAFRAAPTFASGGRGKKGSTSDSDIDAVLFRFDAALTTVEYATRLGGTGIDVGSGYDGQGCRVEGHRVAVFGNTASRDFEPALAGSLHGNRDGWVAELDFAGFAPGGAPAFVHGRYLGGDGDLDSIDRVHFDGLGRLHLAGRATSGAGGGGNGNGRNKTPTVPFPILDNGTGLFATHATLDDGFYAVIDPVGSLLYSSPIGNGSGQRVWDFHFGPAGELCFLVYDGGAATLPTTTSAPYPTPPIARSLWIAVYPARL